MEDLLYSHMINDKHLTVSEFNEFNESWQSPEVVWLLVIFYL